MSSAARKLLTTFQSLDPADRQEVASEILRLTTEDGELDDAAFTEIAANLFRSYDDEESQRAGTN